MPHKDFWKKVWSLNLPGKVINFLWRVCRAFLPTAASLVEKRVQVDIRCQWCLQATETACHVLFDCMFAKFVWTEAKLQGDLQVTQGDTVFEVLNRVLTNCSKEKMVRIIMLCWGLWNRRNKWTWEKTNMSPFGVQAQARNMLDDWREAVKDKQKHGPIVHSSPRRWRTPPLGYVKINIDAATFVKTKHIGVGSVARDDQGRFLRARGR